MTKSDSMTLTQYVFCEFEVKYNFLGSNHLNKLFNKYVVFE